MAKLDLPDIGSLGNPISARAAINSNFTAIENAFDNTLSRDGTLPNQMEADIDLNDNDLLNVRSIDASEYLRDGIPLEQSVAYGNKLYETFDGTGAQTSFTLATHPGSVGNLEVSVDGEMLRPGLDYTSEGTTLTFLIAPAAGTDNILVRYDEALPVGVADADAVLYEIPSTSTNTSVGAYLDSLDGPAGADVVGYTPPSTGLLGTIGSFLDSLWTAGANTGAALLRWIQTGTDVTAQTVQDELRRTLRPEHFGCVGDGVTDDTTNFQKAVTEAITSERELVLDDKTYRLTSTITVPNTLRMTGCSAGTEQDKGTWLFLDHSGKGFDFTPGSGTQTHGNIIKGLATRRTHAVPGPGWVPTGHDWDFFCNQSGGGDHMFEDIFLLNANKGIIASGRATFNRIRGQAFDTFIHAPFNADVSRYVDCHFWPWWSGEANVMAWMLDNTVVFRFQRVDNPMLVNCFSFGAKTGLEISSNPSWGTTYKLHAVNCDFDGGRNGVQVLADADGASLSFDNFQCQSGFPITGGGIGVHVLADNCRINFDNTVLSFHRQNELRIEGANNDVRIGTMEIENYDEGAGGFAAVECAATNKVFFSGRPLITRTSGYGSPIFSGAGLINAPLGYGEFSGTTSVGGDVTITHNSNVTPRNVQAILRAPDVAYILRVESVSSTQFVLRVRNHDGTPVASTAITLYWTAAY